jgi:hypothetical protein
MMFLLDTNVISELRRPVHGLTVVARNVTDFEPVGVPFSIRGNLGKSGARDEPSLCHLTLHRGPVRRCA